MTFATSEEKQAAINSCEMILNEINGWAGDIQALRDAQTCIFVNRPSPVPTTDFARFAANGSYALDALQRAISIAEGQMKMLRDTAENANVLPIGT